MKPNEPAMQNDPRVEAACRAVHDFEMGDVPEEPAWDAQPEEVKDYFRRQLACAIAAADAATPSPWRPISEDNQPPLDTDVLLGWWDSFPITTWRVEAGFYGSTRGGWIHGRATHWQPFPPLPEQEGK